MVSDSCIVKYISRPNPRTVVLHSAIHIVRHFVIYIYMVELTHRKFFSESPCFSHVTCNVQTSIITVNHVRRVFWMNPPSVVVWVNSRVRNDFFPRLSAIFRPRNSREKAIYSVFVFSIYKDVSIIEWTISNVLSSCRGCS